MKIFITAIVVSLLLSAGVSFGQDAAPAPAPAAQPSVDGVDSMNVRAALEREKQKRERARVELQGRERELMDQIGELEAQERETMAQIPALEKQLEQAVAAKNEAEKTLNKVGAEYAEAERTEREQYKQQIISEANAKNDAEYRRLLAKHEQDTTFLNRNKWSRDDFGSLEVGMDPEDPSRKIRFSGSGSDRVSGVYPTVDFATGKKTWHNLPGDAYFSISIGGENQFLADAAIHPGSDTLGVGSTNALDWDIHIHVAKDFDPPKDAASRYRLVAVAWPVDIGRKQCWQVGEPPTFVPTPKPEPKVVTEDTPEMKALIDKWAFTNPGWIQNLENAKADLKQATQLVRVIQRRRPKIEERVKRKLAEIAEKKKELEPQLETIRIQLQEYEDDTVAPAPEEGGADLNNAGAGTPEAGGENAGGEQY